jgi:hypothetical protein
MADLPPAQPSPVRDSWLWPREKADWGRWWRGLPGIRRIAPLAGVMAFWLAHALLGGFRGDHALLGLAVLAFAYGGPRFAPWFRLLLPLALMGAVYDGQSYVRPMLHGQLTVHVTEPADFDRRVFGIKTAAGVLTPPEWWQQHLHPALDVLCSFIYLSFVPVFAALALGWRWQGGRRTDAAGARQVHETESMTWAFFWLGLISCVTYYLYPAAPPWYLAEYGTGPAVLDAVPSAAGAARVDALLGVTLFADIYGRSPNVFGAIPSLHVAIPMLGAAFAWQVGKLRLLTTVYALLMAFAAVYLNHHHVLDLLWGAAYALLAMVLVRLFRRRAGPA